MPANGDRWSEDRWNRLVTRWISDFGPDAAARMIESTIYECGSERITIPSIKDLQRRERDRKICSLFQGNYQELAARFDLDECTIRRIILKQRMIDRSKDQPKNTETAD